MESTELTALIRAAHDGDKDAADRLFTAIYGELRRIAAQQLRGRGAMSTTSLVHEAYEKLARPAALGVNDRQHLYASAARAMRQIVVDHARERGAVKRGGDFQRVELDGSEPGAEIALDELVALDRTLTELESLDERLARLVELRFFGGMTLEEAGAALALSSATLKRDWRRARAFLHAALDATAPAA